MLAAPARDAETVCYLDRLVSLQTPLCPRLSESSMRGRLRVPSVTHALHGILQKVELLAPTARIHRSVEIALKQGKQAELASWRRHQLSVLISAPHTGEWSRMRAAGLGVSVIVQHLERCLLLRAHLYQEDLHMVCQLHRARLGRSGMEGCLRFGGEILQLCRRTG